MVRRRINGLEYIEKIKQKYNHLLVGTHKKPCTPQQYVGHDEITIVGFIKWELNINGAMSIRSQPGQNITSGSAQNAEQIVVPCRWK